MDRNTMRSIGHRRRPVIRGRSSSTQDASNADLPWRLRTSPDWGRVIDVRRTNPCGRFRPACGAELVLTSGVLSGHLPAETAHTSTSFTIFEGTSEIQRMIIGRAVTGLDVR